ncbi:hypothetical protein DPMN_103771 [Dreissena polymorpha]|uniref:Uncharacterized protein n=1 Tax=Dreissena polymorpha TaxID=45954 RepID=A0A9D4K2H2_DREPO|nr:hypothetical protein DPMN_103771 [Dreissena polymorpha]
MLARFWYISVVLVHSAIPIEAYIVMAGTSHCFDYSQSVKSRNGMLRNKMF